MIYYNYSPFYHSPVNQYPNVRYPNLPHRQNYLSSSMNNSHIDSSIEKNIQTRQPLSQTNPNIKHSKINSQSVQKENFCKEKQSYDEALFEILGIKLYFDDVLLICLIFFLYTEGVQDQYLFIVLILLLLS